MLKRNSFSGGVNSATITTANSGGASGNAFYDVSGAPIYTTSQATGGRSPLVARLLDGDDLWYDITLAARTVWVRAYIYITEAPSSDSPLIFDTELRNLVQLNTDRTLSMTSGGFTPTTWVTTTTAVPLNTWCRIEAKLVVGTTSSNGSCELRLYTSADSATAADTKTATGKNTGTALPTAMIWHYAYDITLLLDDPAVTDVDWPGPASISQTVTPGTLAATSTVPAPAVSAGLSTTPGTVSSEWSVPSPSVYTGSITVPVNPGLVSAEWSVEAPTVEAFKNVNVTPQTVVVTPVIPSPNIGVPVNPGDRITRAGQIEWNGFLLGSTTPYRWQTLEGWVTDLPGIDSGNVPHPSRHGAYAGRDLAQERYVTFTAGIRPEQRAEMQAAIDDIIAATPILEDDTELPLAVRILDTIYVGYGKITRRAIPVDDMLRMGVGKLTLQWTLSDPLLLSRELNSAVVADGSAVPVTNTGNAVTYPLIRCPGPATHPMVAVTRTRGGVTDTRILEFSTTVASGKTLIIDTYYGTATVAGDDVMDTLTGYSVPVPDLVLASGQSDITYATTSRTAPAATVLWRHAVL